MVLAMLDTEATTLARGRLRLSLAILVLATAMAAMVLAMLATEATTLARGRLRLSLAILVLAMALWQLWSWLCWLQRPLHWQVNSAQDCSHHLLPSDQNKIVKKNAQALSSMFKCFYTFQNLIRCFRFPNQ